MSGTAVSLQDIEDAAGEFEKASRESQQLAKRIQEVAETLEQGWTGESQEAFSAHHREWQSLIQAQALLLTGISNELRALVARYRQADGGQRKEVYGDR